MGAYLDASVLLPILIEEPASQAVDAYILAGAQEFLVSAAEVASGLSRLVRMGLFEALDAAARLADFDVWRAATSVAADVPRDCSALTYGWSRTTGGWPLPPENWT